ncbi:MAG: hypothetical protein HYW02_04560, partial [Deltaproteobacteria bacterium]|nr:hypothetical protein [Deltaproteobacteria bacterium]
RPSGEGAAPIKPQTGLDFDKLLQEQMGQSENTQKMIEGMFGTQSEGGSSLKVMSGEGVTVDPDKVAGAKRSDLLHVLNDVNRSALQMDQMIEMVTSGQKFNPQELLAIQAGVYQVVMEVDLTGQIVSSADRARNSLLNIQI